MRTVLLRYFYPVLFIFALPAFSFAQGQDSINLKIHPVQCFGLRNGAIEVVEVFWGSAPYYFSLDGHSYSTRPVIDLLWAGEYVLHVRDSTGYEREYPVLVPEPEEFRVKLTADDSSIVAGEWFHLKATVFPAGTALTEIDWRPPNLILTPNQLTQLVRIADSTDFAIEIRNTAGCIARDNITIGVEKTNLYFPNAFAPNSNQDNYFTMFAGDGVDRIKFLQIFGRNGQLVFEKRNFLPNDPLSGWNGKWRGREAPAGTYVWVAQVAFLGGNVQVYSGNVTLIN